MSEKEPPCSQAETQQFDFWLGEWDLTWGEGAQGTNRISKILDGCVILEEFDGTPGVAFKGMSVSTYNATLRKWQQTWVDNAGGYLDFVGEFSNGQMILARETIVEGKAIQQRMVFYHITEHGLDWNWERSEDAGKTWQVLWHIHYQRKNVTAPDDQDL